MLWDYGNVLIDWNPRYYYKTIITDPKRLDYFLSEVCPMSWHEKNDEGIGMDAHITNRQKQFPEFATEIGMWRKDFGKMIIGKIKETNEIINSLYEQGFPQYCLTNLAQEVEKACIDDLGFRKYFKDIIVSGTEKCVKPNPKIYEITLERLKLKPEEIFFTDDRLDNINAAKEMGFQTHQFKNDGQLKLKLQEVGILK